MFCLEDEEELRLDLADLNFCPSVEAQPSAIQEGCNETRPTEEDDPYSYIDKLDLTDDLLQPAAIVVANLRKLFDAAMIYHDLRQFDPDTDFLTYERYPIDIGDDDSAGIVAAVAAELCLEDPLGAFSPELLAHACWLCS